MHYRWHVPSTDRPAAATAPSPEIQRLLDDLAASPSPYHAVATAVRALTNRSFGEVSLEQPLPTTPGRYMATVGGSLVAWIVPDAVDGHRFTVVGAHTDSPNLRVRANADVRSAGWAQVGVETYGGLLLNSWLDRDLGLAGRVSVLVDGVLEERLLLDDRPILRIPQLAIHLDRDIREKGLNLDPQKHLTPLWAVGEASPTVAEYVADQISSEGEALSPNAIVSWDLMAFDTQRPALVGLEQDLLASARIDNLLSSFCAVEALGALESQDVGPGVPVLVLYDHEEIGSTSATGAAGSMLPAFLERVSASLGVDRVGHLEALTRSLVVSADGAHATHPNYVDRHEPSHQIEVNAGVVVKRNANQRYATDAISEGRFRAVCAEADVPLQTYIHRNDLPCGSTIGPVTAGQLAVPTVDIGAPQLAMHSVRELAGVADAGHLTAALGAVYRNA